METLAAITTLDREQVSQAGALLGLDSQRMLLRVPSFVGIGSPVKVEANDTLALGEVSYCRPDGDGFTVWVELVEALHNVNELTRLAQALVA